MLVSLFGSKQIQKEGYISLGFSSTSKASISELLTLWII